MNTTLMAKIDILLNLINFANDMLNENMPPTTSYSPMRHYSNNDNYLKKALGIKNEHQDRFNTFGRIFVFESILDCFSGKMYFKYGGWSAVEPVYIIKIFIIGLLFVSAGIFINKKIGRVINALIGLNLLIISIEIFTTQDPAGIQSKIGYPSLISGFLVLLISILFFYLAFRSEKNIKRYPEYMWCADCGKFYRYEDVKNTDQICPDCGKKLTEYNDGDYWRRNAPHQGVKPPKPKKSKCKKR